MEILKVINELFNIPSTKIGEEYIKELAKRISKLLGVKYVMVGRPSPSDPEIIQLDTLWAGDRFGDNFEYHLQGTPCLEVVSDERICLFDRDVAKLFPRDLLLGEMCIESYGGAPVKAADGKIIGLLVTLDENSMKNRELVHAVLESCSGRLGAEYSRMKTEQQLKILNKELGDELDERTIELNKANRKLLGFDKMNSVSTLVTGIAHELRNPFNITVNSVHILKDLLSEESLKNKEDLDEVVGMIDEASLRTNVLLDSILEKVTTENEKKKPLAGILIALQEEFKDLYPEIQVDLEVSNISGVLLPEVTVSRVITNVLENSADAISDLAAHGCGQINPVVSIVAVGGSAKVELMVRDGGIGMSESSKDRIFEPFYTTKSIGKGSGLGMYMVFNLINGLNGSIEVKSKKFKGCEVKISIPLLERA